MRMPLLSQTFPLPRGSWCPSVRGMASPCHLTVCRGIIGRALLLSSPLLSLGAFFDSLLCAHHSFLFLFSLYCRSSLGAIYSRFLPVVVFLPHQSPSFLGTFDISISSLWLHIFILSLNLWSLAARLSLTMPSPLPPLHVFVTGTVDKGACTPAARHVFDSLPHPSPDAKLLADMCLNAF
ncbi:hypothetical protein BS78_03G411300 [Paspalum vaginatum]|nr:hypothetical protein BS78_03G411300 [Paspalum vaginatum]